MRMNFFFGNIFWGILLILWGASLILKTFNINMPLAKIFIAVIIIMFGLKLLIGTSSKTYHKPGPTKGSYYHSNRSGEYNIIFSSGTIDLRDITENTPSLEITVVFGSATVILPAHLNYDIEPTSVFGSTVMPEKSHYGFGGGRYRRGNEKATPIHIESNAIFGQLVYVFEDVENTQTDPVVEDVATENTQSGL
ncbi:MAG: hypothetical protein PHO85_02165 [Candidatus Cloacimonetes bacterium]|nr:hypothetical protein [Candidatus Cloacimonadota bacterium]MDD4147305.1 hypothetical protein [Candidatus Cloacimonadota bacterium]MDD4559779.1 hypothetical protein [Candidatus Cloacimonadota bacterium]